jgi:hypothetical protein
VLKLWRQSKTFNTVLKMPKNNFSKLPMSIKHIALFLCNKNLDLEFLKSLHTGKIILDPEVFDIPGTYVGDLYFLFIYLFIISMVPTTVRFLT